MGAKHYGGIFLLSAATLLLELSLMRVLSVANWYHFGFLIISTALLAFGTSGVVLNLWSKLREQASLDQALATLSLAFGIVTLASYLIVQQIPFDPFALLDDRRQLLFIPLYYLVAGSPFFCSGLAIGLLLSRGGHDVPRLYAADLIGAGIGCSSLVLLMPIFGGAGSVVVAAMLGFSAASIFGLSTIRAAAITSLTLGLLAGPLAITADYVLPISVIPAKHHPLKPVGQTPIYTAWNAFSQVELFKLPAMAEQGRPDAGYSIIIDGGGAGSAIPDLSGGVVDYLKHSTDYRPTGISYVGKSHPAVLILGSGAGRDVLEALKYGARSITAVEINPIINDIVTNRMQRSLGGLFEQPEVRVVTEEGRSFLRRSKEHYDVIISNATITSAAVTSGALAMSESYLFTLEAFEDLYDHLTPDGVILITRPTLQIAKLFATVREVFEKRGLGDPGKHLFAFEGPLSPYGHELFDTGLMFKKSPWTQSELATVTDRLGVGHPERWFGQAPKIYYSPLGVSPKEANAFSGELVEILSAPNLGAVYSAHREQLSPATDDKPFFNQTIKWSSVRPYDFRLVFGAGGRGNALIQPVAETMLIIMLIQSIATAVVLIVVPLLRFRRGGSKFWRPVAFLGYFAALGLGFIMIEIVFIQRFILFLGQPAYTFAVVLAGLLVFTGIGSMLVGLTRQPARRALVWIVAAILTDLLVTVTLSPSIFAAGLGLPLGWRIAIVVSMIAPLGVMLGMPFPIGLQLVGKEAPVFVPWAWGVNGFFTVIGSIGSTILGMAYGFATVLVISALCYLAALLALMIASRSVSVVGPSEQVLGGRELSRQAPTS